MRSQDKRSLGRFFRGKTRVAAFLFFSVTAFVYGQQTWTKASAVPVTDSLMALCYGNSVWVCVGAHGDILTSTDASAWTKRTTAAVDPGMLMGVAWAVNKFIVVGNKGLILTSADGTAWDSQVSGTTMTLSSVVNNGALSVAVGDSGTILTSTNGTTWTKQTSVTKLFLQNVAWGNGKFFAVGGSPWPQGINGLVLSSSDGAAWTLVKENYPIYLRSMAISASKYVAVGQFEGGSGDPSSVVLSDNGTTWTSDKQTLVEDRFSLFEWLYGITYGQGRFVTVGSNGTVMYSIDGLSRDSVGLVYQRVKPEPVTTDLNAVAFGNGKYVAVGNSGIIISSPATGVSITWPKAPLNVERRHYSLSGSRLRYQLDASSFVTVAIRDMNGRQVLRLFSGNQRPGNHTVTIPAALSQGIYMLMCQSGAVKFERPIAIVR